MLVIGILTIELLRLKDISEPQTRNETWAVALFDFTPKPTLGKLPVSNGFGHKQPYLYVKPLRARFLEVFHRNQEHYRHLGDKATGRVFQAH